MKKYILFSLSMGVLAILRGKIKIEQVQMVISGTKFVDIINEALTLYYQNGVWEDYSEKEVLEVLNALTIIQPRLTGAEPPNIAKGFCLDVTTQTWSKPL